MSGPVLLYFVNSSLFPFTMKQVTFTHKTSIQCEPVANMTFRSIQVDSEI